MKNGRTLFWVINYWFLNNKPLPKAVFSNQWVVTLPGFANRFSSA
jgi:hypothetical protein